MEGITVSRPASTICTGLLAPFQRARGDCRGVADTQTAGLPCLLLEVLLCQCAELRSIFLLNCAAFAVELLYIVEPRNPPSNLGRNSVYCSQRMVRPSRPKRAEN